MTSRGTVIDPTARVDPQAEIGQNVAIGPYCIVGPGVRLGDDVRLAAHVNLAGLVDIGPRTAVYPFASLGTPPQSTKYKGEPTRLTVGADCDIRENVTMNTGTVEGGGVTRVGDRCFFMVGSHVAHDCDVGNEVIVANNVLLAGHVTVGDFTVFGGQAAVKQFVRIGEGAMVIGVSGVRADVIPWGLVSGHYGALIGLNVVGLRRRGYSKSDVHLLRQAYQGTFFGEGTFRQRLDELAASNDKHPLVARMVEFIRAGTRPLTMAVNRAESDDLS
jgi:UDP-N-acetylglucosamine acyltransferase